MYYPAPAGLKGMDKMKITRILALLLSLVLLLGALAGCAETLSGTYKAETLGTGASYTFDGKNVKVDVLVLGTVATTLEGTYEIKDNKITLTFGDTESEEAKTYGGTFDFAETETSIKIGLIEYTKVQ